MYKITKEQLESIEHYERMFRTLRDDLNNLCKEDRPDILIGFELGRNAKYCGDWANEIMELIKEIKFADE